MTAGAGCCETNPVHAVHGATAAPPAQPAYPNMICCVLEGKWGKVFIPRNNLLPVSQLQNSLKPLHYTDFEVTEEEGVNTLLTTATFASVRMWVLSRSSLVRSNLLS